MRATGNYGTALRAARAAAVLLPELLPRTTAVVRDNLRLAYGRSDDGLMRAVYRHFAEATTDFAFFRKLFDPARFDRHFRFVGGGLEHYRETRPGAAVLVTGHFGNWELYGAAFRHIGVPVAPVARPPGNSWLARVVASFRAEQGQQVIPKKNALPLAMKALRRGVCVAFLADQAAGRHGIPIPFFGRPASTYTAPAALALKLGIPLYAGYSTRIGDGISYRCFAEPVSTEGDIETITTRLNALLESYVRARPEQWWWFHRRFKPRRLERAKARSGPAGVPLTP